MLSLLVRTATRRRSHEVMVATDLVTASLAVRCIGLIPVPRLNTRAPSAGERQSSASGSGPQRIIAPMPGKVVRVRGQTWR
ncbi:MAG: hypothetical protein QM736_14470 [Vicinamibacterales bacterium]